MGALVGLGVGIGLMLVWSAFFLPRRPRLHRDRTGRAAQLLARAGSGRSPRPGSSCCVRSSASPWRC